MKKVFKFLFGMLFPRINQLLSNFPKKRSKGFKKPQARQARKPDEPLPVMEEIHRHEESSEITSLKSKADDLVKSARGDGIGGSRSAAKNDIELACQTSVVKVNCDYDVREERVNRKLVEWQNTLMDDSHQTLENAKLQRQKIERLQKVEQGGIIKVKSKKSLSISEQISVTETKLENALEVKERQDVNYDALMSERYDGKVPQKSWIDNKVFFYSTVILLALLEWYSNFDALQNVAGFIKNNFLAMIFAMFLAGTQAFGAKGFGAALFNGERKQMINFLILTIVACGFICVFRFDLRYGLLASFASMFVNVMIAILTIFLSFLHHRHNEIFTCIDKREKASAIIRYCRMELERLGKLNKSQRALVEVESKEESLQREGDRKEGVKAQIEQLQLTLDSLKLERARDLAQLEQIKNDALAKYERDFQRAFKVAGHKASNGNSTSTHTNGALLPCLILIAAMTVAGCGNDLPETHVELVLDVTGNTACFNPAEVEEELFDALMLEEASDWGDVTVNISTISHVTETSVNSIKLEKSGNFLFRNENEHEGKIEKFREELVRAVESAALSREEKLHSYVNRNLTARMDYLSRQKGDRLILVWSDLLQHRPMEVSFYHYKHDPSKLLRDADEVRKRLEEDSPLPDMQGMRLVNFHLPQKSTDELHLAAKKIFSDYWQGKGLEVEFKAAAGKANIQLVKAK